MTYYKYPIGLIILIFLPAILAAQQEKQEIINIVNMKKNLEFLASDSLQGRSFGTEINGTSIAADFIREKAIQAGLEPGIPDFFQQFMVQSSAPLDKHAFLEVVCNSGKSRFSTHDIVEMNGVNGMQRLEKEEVVFAGFGYCNDSASYDDLAGIDLKGKIVVIAEGLPARFSEEGKRSWDNHKEHVKHDRILQNKPRAVLVIIGADDPSNTMFERMKRWFSRQRFEWKSAPGLRDSIPVLLSVPQLADALLGGKSKYQRYLEQISKSGDPNSFPCNKMKISGILSSPDNEFQGINVIGMIPGSDPEVKDEPVVYMAHYDHLGVDKNGDVFNGADDNGSGTVALLEIARTFAALKEKPKRTVVFLWVTGEETSMIGSGYYTSNPVFPLDKTKACINLDMVGRVYEPRDSVWKKSPKLVKDANGLFTLTNQVWPQLTTISDSVCATLGLVPDKTLPESFLRSSDHYHFHKHRIPVLSVSTGYHADYHKVTDEVSRIRFDKMKSVTEYGFLVGKIIANGAD